MSFQTRQSLALRQLGDALSVPLRLRRSSSGVLAPASLSPVVSCREYTAIQSENHWGRAKERQRRTASHVLSQEGCLRNGDLAPGRVLPILHPLRQRDRKGKHHAKWNEPRQGRRA